MNFHFTPSIRLASAVVAILIGSSTAARAVDISASFNDIAVGTTYPNATLPRTITTAGVDVALSKFQGSLGANGRIVERAAGDNALFLAANLRAEIVLTAPSATGGFFFFRNQGGDNLLEINGATVNFTHSGLAGNGFGEVGGVTFNSSGPGPFRSVKVGGPIYTIAFIGQELSIDRVTLALVDQPPAPGDFNLDGIVNGRDLLAWQRGSSPRPRTVADLTEWHTSFAPSSPNAMSATTVPEPTTATLLASCALVLLLALRR